MTSFRVAQLLREGIAAAKAGDGPRAQELLMQVVDADEQNEQAWIWLSGVVESDADREVCLENVLAINPNNSLAKAGLAHLRSRRTAPTTPPPPPPQPEPAPPSPEPEPEPAPPPASEVETATSDDWWDQPFSLDLGDEPLAPATTDDPFALQTGDDIFAPATTSEPDSLLEARLASAAAPPVQTRPERPAPALATPEQAQPLPEKTKKKEKRKRRKQSQARRLLGVAFLLLGLLTAGLAVAALLQVGPFDPTVRAYAQVMRPLLDDYDAWWDGSYGALVGELNSLCGPGSDGWRNQDVLLACNRYAALDCALLAAHCGADVEEMRARVSELSAQAGQKGAELRTSFDDVVPPADVALAHGRFLDCLQARVDNAALLGRLARGELSAVPISAPLCQMFASAEDDVRRYMGGQ